MLKFNCACVASSCCRQCFSVSLYRQIQLQFAHFFNRRFLSIIPSTYNGELRPNALQQQRYAASRLFNTSHGACLPIPLQPHRLATRIAAAPNRLHQPSVAVNSEHDIQNEGLHDKMTANDDYSTRTNVYNWNRMYESGLSTSEKVTNQAKNLKLGFKSQLRSPGYGAESSALINTNLASPLVEEVSPEVKAMQEEHLLRHSRFLLRSFVSMCTETDLLNLAFYHVQRIRKLIVPPNSTVGRTIGKPDLRVYNGLLRAYAKQCNGARTYEITKWIADDKLLPDVFTFAHWLEFLGRDAIRSANAGRVHEKERDAVQVTLNQMERCKVKPRDIFRRCQFLGDEREMILHAVRLVEPRFEPAYSSKKIADSYHSSLLSSLNDRDYRGPHAIDNSQEPLGSPYAGLFTRETLSELLDEQIQAERVGKMEIPSIFQDQVDMRLQDSEQARIGVENNTWQQRVRNEINDTNRPEFQERQLQTEKYRAMLNELKKTWETSLTTYLTRERSRIINAPQGSRKPSIDPYLLALSPAELAQVLVDELINVGSFSPNYSPALFSLELELGTAIHRRFMIRMKENYGVLDALQKLMVNYYDCFLPPSGDTAAAATTTDLQKFDFSTLNHRQYWLRLSRQISVGPSPVMPQAVWPREVRLELGRRLYEILVEANVVLVPDNMFPTKSGKVSPFKHSLPAVFTIHRTKKTGTSIQVKPNPRLAKLLKLAAVETLSFDVQVCPMLVPPLPWVSQTSGGYLLSPTILTRLPDQARSVRSVVDMAKPRTLYPVFDALNIVGASPWKVNTEMLDLLIGVFNHGGMPDLNVPSPASAATLVAQHLHPNMTDLQKQRQVHKEKAEMHSLWCEALYKLSLAQHFRHRYFFLPHNMDFRGRVYPVAPHLQQMSNDLTRSLMLFGKGRPLGPTGFDWLKIHCVNLTGNKKKASIEQRLQYANEVLESDILDSAQRPLTGRGWWKQSDDPWQTLACCKEIRNVLNSNVPPEEYVCHFPVHQDGSCNGLQHYAALGRDKHGAQSVNLRPNDKPQDVYSAVAARVEGRRVQDAAAGNECAQILEGFISRKVVKQTVMTIVYGVTKFGARTQILSQLQDVETFPQVSASAAARYLATQTFGCIGEIFHSARHIQDWITQCARDICKIRGMPVEWQTPLGLPVSQPYFKFSVPNAYTTRAFAVVKQACPYKQANGMAPNYIHSLDSTHMMLTALYCHRANLSFVAVHDSFWTHPSTLESMGKILREQFVALHEKPLLENLSQSFVDQFALKDLPEFNLRHEIREAESMKSGTSTTKSKRGRKSAEPSRRESKLSTEMQLLAPAQRKRWEKHEFNRLLSQVPEKGTFDLNEVLESEFFFS